MDTETVVLVHGLWMNGMDMSLLARRLRRQGYEVVQYKYHTMFNNPRENARRLNDMVSRLDSPIVHFVCHSLGGLVIRHFFYLFPDQRPGRVVTLGTPHKPSYSAYKISRLPFGKVLLGKSIEDGLLGNTPKWNGSHDLGSIAGNLRLGLGMVIPGIPRPNDGTVSVEETRLDKMKDHAVLKVSHFALLLSLKAADYTVAFLRNGKFPSI